QKGSADEDGEGDDHLGEQRRPAGRREHLAEEEDGDPDHRHCDDRERDQRRCEHERGERKEHRCRVRRPPPSYSLGTDRGARDRAGDGNLQCAVVEVSDELPPSKRRMSWVVTSMSGWWLARSISMSSTVVR